jgi:hypothetical protein
VTRVPSDQEFPITSLFAEALERGEQIGAFQVLEDWMDVGHRDQLAVARGWV